MENCLQCNSDNVCTTCITNYNPSPDGSICVLCSVAECSICSSVNSCGTCNEGFSVSNTGTCVACAIDQCSICEFNNICQQCNADHTLSTNLAQCLSCNIEHCISCSTAADTCTACESNYSLNVAGSTSCDLCAVANCERCNG